MTRAALLIALAGVGLTAEAAQGQTQVNQWVQYGTTGNVLARAILSPVAAGTTTACPALSVDGTSYTMNPRSTATTLFPVQECEASLPFGGAVANIGGVALKMPVAQPRRIVVIGDTGCRLKSPSSYQACNDPAPDTSMVNTAGLPSGFPLASVASYVASFSPDLIIHVGDYYYRESACPTANQGNGTTTGCGGSPTGDQWTSWNADWFTPAQAMMSAAPLALIRGNHESCGRGEKGWFTLLDPQPMSVQYVGCAAGSAGDYQPPYTIAAGSTTLLMFDSSYANDTTAANSSLVISNYQRELNAITPSLSGNVIYVTHKPTYGLSTTSGSGTSQVTSGGDQDEQNVFSSNGIPSSFKLFLSGHIHNMQAVKLSTPGYPPQFVVGDSGTLLDPLEVASTTPGSVYSIPGPGTTATVQNTSDTSEYGFAVLNVAPGGYTVNLYYLNGLPHGTCVIQLTTRNLACSN